MYKICNNNVCTILPTWWHGCVKYHKALNLVYFSKSFCKVSDQQDTWLINYQLTSSWSVIIYHLNGCWIAEMVRFIFTNYKLELWSIFSSTSLGSLVVILHSFKPTDIKRIIWLLRYLLIGHSNIGSKRTWRQWWLLW